MGGTIAGALDSGSLNLWDADKLVSGDTDALVSSTKKHSGAIKALQFNPKHSNLLATGGGKGELFITDLNNAESPIRLGNTAARADDIDCLDWNKKVSHIMVTGSSGGFVTVWDMKAKKESLTLNNAGRKAVSAVAWDPENPTKLITATSLEQEPLILVWDLRNANAPERTLRGHDSGVLSLSWCPQDHDLLLSCGKDNRTICWNPQTGQPYGDFSVVTNWTFQTRWNPHNPNLFATASFDGKLSIQTLQNANAAAVESSNHAQALDGEDFFSKAQTQPQASSFSLPKAPRWLERPVSASFGFGGRLVSITPAEPGKSRMSKICITKFEVDSSIGAATDNFESAMQSGDLASICRSRIAETSSEEEKADWKVIETLVSSNSRKELIDYLSIRDTKGDADGVAKVGQEDEKKSSLRPEINGTAKGHKHFASIFESTPDGDFLAELSATKGARPNNPFHIYSVSEVAPDREITRALILGQFDKAVELCIKEDRMSDAFMVAICGGEACIQKAQEAYFSKQSSGPNYLRLLASVVGKNLWDVVHNADLTDWKEVMATLCTFADEQEFPDLCEALGDRLEELVQDQPKARKDASFCFLAGSKLEKVVSIWIDELQESEKAGVADEADASAFSLHARGLQNLIEKVTVFRSVTNFQDADVTKDAEWKLEDLYSKYVDYADIVAAHGQLSVAERYLDLLPTKYPDAEVARSRIKQATKRTAPTPSTIQATSAPGPKSLPPIGGYQPQQTISTPVAPQMPTSYNASAQNQTANAYAPTNPAQSGNPYAPSAPLQPTNTYIQPHSSQATNPYAPRGGYQPLQQMRAPDMVAPPSRQYGAPQTNPIPPPPRAYNQSPSIAPPSRPGNVPNWNDIPEGFVKPPTSRRGTPSVPSQNVSAPFPGQPLTTTPLQPTAPSMGSSRRVTPPVVPPPKGPAPPGRVTSPLTVGLPQQMQSSEKSLSSTSAYAPFPSVTSPPSVQSLAQPAIPRGPSPYNAPPSNVPHPNRYAPAPNTQSAAPQPHLPVGPPPQFSSYQSTAPPMNPYAPPQSGQNSAPSPYTPVFPSQQPSQTRTQIAPPPSQAAAPQPSSRPSTANSDRRPLRPAAPKHRKPSPCVRNVSNVSANVEVARGDRSHILKSAEPIYSILASEMARVKARAPSSFKAQVDDTEKRLNYLFDHLNNEELLKPDTVGMLVELSQALQARDFDRAGALQREIHTDKVDECGNWMVGVKRLVGMCRATP